MARTQFSLIAFFVCTIGFQSILAEPNVGLYSPYNPADVAAAAASTSNIAQSEAIKDSLYNDNHLDYQDILSCKPHYLFCDCDFTSFIDPNIATQLKSIAFSYQQRYCDTQQWYMLVDRQMESLKYERRIAMITSIAQAVQEEQIRKGLTNIDSYPVSCSYLYKGVANPLVRRSESATTLSAYVNNDYFYYYNNIESIYNRFMPNLSKQLRDSISASVYAYSGIQQLPAAPALIQQFYYNIRFMLSQKYTYKPYKYPVLY